MDALARWLLTYLLHSTFLLGAMLALRALLRERRLALQEALLRAALVGGLVTASLSLVLGLRPLAGSVGLGQGRAAERPAAAIAWQAPEAPAGDEVLLPGRSDTVAAQAPAASAPVSDPLWLRRARDRWPVALLTLWLTLALVGATRLSVAAARLRQLLGGRRAVQDGTLARGVRAVSQTLGLRSKPRLSAAPRLTVPVATGVLKPEVCLPTRALVDLGDEEQVALCSHELAHLARRDPAWLLVARTIEVIAPIQPLNHWARRRLSDLAECLSDDLAVSACAQPLGLARSLVDVASWTLSRPTVLSATAAGAFGAQSRLAYRVERLMDPLRRLERPRRFLLPLAIVGVCATALITPVASGDDSAEDALPAPAAVVAPVPPVAPLPAAPPVPVIEPMPAPAPLPRVAAAPAPPARPASPPAPPAAGASNEEQRLERLTQRIEERVRLRERDMAKIVEKIAARAAQVAPKREELERLSRELAEAASKSAEAALSGVKAEQRAELTRHMSELQREIAEQVQDLQLPREEFKALEEQMHALAAQVRPTAEEQAELGRLAAELARDAMPDREELERIVREATETAREQMEHARETAHQAGEEIERAREQTHALAQHAAEEAREQLEHAREQEQKARQEAQRHAQEQAHAAHEKAAAEAAAKAAAGAKHDDEPDEQH